MQLHEIAFHLRKSQLKTTESLPLSFPLRPSEKVIPQGNFNSNTLFDDAQGRTYILRQENPIGRREELPYVIDEYSAVGFLDNPDNGFRLRNSEEQYLFSRSLAVQGVNSVVPIFADKDKQIVPYIHEAQSIADVWISDPERALIATERAIVKLGQAHSDGIVIGDRWGPNELVTLDGDILFVDFDIEIWGPEAKEFELSSLLYFVSYFAQKNSGSDMKRLRDLYSQYINDEHFVEHYDEDILKRYISRYAEFFVDAKKYSWTDKGDCRSFFNDL